MRYKIDKRLGVIRIIDTELNKVVAEMKCVYLESIGDWIIPKHVEDEIEFLYTLFNSQEYGLEISESYGSVEVYRKGKLRIIYTIDNEEDLIKEIDSDIKALKLLKRKITKEARNVIYNNSTI